MAEEMATSTQPSPSEKRRRCDSPEDTDLLYDEIPEPPNIQATTLNTLDWCSKTFGPLLEDSSTHDIVFKTSDGDSVGAHRLIVAAGSPVFRAMLYGNMRESSQKEIELPTTDTDTLNKLLKFMYTGKVNVNSKCIIKILDAAHYLNIASLEEILVEFVKNSLDVMNVFFFVNVATHKTFSNQLLEHCLEFMYDHANEIFHNENFKKLSNEVILLLCKSSDLNIKELDLFLAVVEWYKHQDQVSETVVRSIFQEIRYPLIPKSDLVQRVRPTKLADPSLYTAALEYHLFPDTYEGPQIQISSRKHRPEGIIYTNVTPRYMRVHRNSDGIVIKRVANNQLQGIYGLCTIQVYPTKWHPVHFKIVWERFTGNSINLVTRSYAVTNPVIPSNDVTDGINITRCTVDGTVSVRGNNIVTTVGSVSRITAKQREVYLCVHMRHAGEEVVFSLT